MNNATLSEVLLAEQIGELESSNALLSRKVEAYERALKRLVGKCGAGHVCCSVTTDIAQRALEAVRDEKGETK